MVKKLKLDREIKKPTKSVSARELYARERLEKSPLKTSDRYKDLDNLVDNDEDNKDALTTSTTS